MGSPSFCDKILDFIETKLDGLLLNDDLSINYSSVTDIIIHHFFKDLDTYYQTEYSCGADTNSFAREAILRHASERLRK